MSGDEVEGGDIISVMQCDRCCVEEPGAKHTQWRIQSVKARIVSMRVQKR